METDSSNNSEIQNCFRNYVNKVKNVTGFECWKTAKEYSVEEMLRTFDEAIEFVVKDSKIDLVS